MSMNVNLNLQAVTERVRFIAARIVSRLKPEPRRVPVSSSIHPARAHIHEIRSIGDKVADEVASTMGSWRFIIAQSIIVAIWIGFNLAAIHWHWDPYPFILLNLLFSTQAAYAAPVIMMSQNRQAAKDRIRDDQEAREVDNLTVMNQQQLEILLLLRKLVADEGKGDEAA